MDQPKPPVDIAPSPSRGLEPFVAAVIYGGAADVEAAPAEEEEDECYAEADVDELPPLAHLSSFAPHALIFLRFAVPGVAAAAEQNEEDEPPAPSTPPAGGGVSCSCFSYASAEKPCMDPVPPSDRSVHSLLALSNGCVAVSGSDSDVQLWNPSRPGARPRRLTGHTELVWAIAELRPGLLLSASWDTSLRLWDLETMQCAGVMTGHLDRIWTIASLEDGNSAISGGWDGELRVWQCRPEASSCSAVLRGHSGSKIWTCCALGGSLCASGAADGSICVWDVSGAGELKHTLHDEEGGFAHRGTVSALASGGAGRLLSGGWEGDCRLWNCETGVCERLLSPQPGVGKVTALHLLDSGTIAASYSSGRLLLWGEAAHPRICSGHLRSISIVAALPGGRVLTGGADNAVRIWQAESGECERTVKADGARLPAFAAGEVGHCASGRSIFFHAKGSVISACALLA